MRSAGKQEQQSDARWEKTPAPFILFHKGLHRPEARPPRAGNIDRRIRDALIEASAEAAPAVLALALLALPLALELVELAVLLELAPEFPLEPLSKQPAAIAAAADNPPVQLMCSAPPGEEDINIIRKAPRTYRDRKPGMS